MLHEGFARALTHSLGAYLRVVFETNVVSVEQLTFREFLSRIPDFAYSASFTVNPMGVAGVMVLDLSLTFPIIDLLLGGNGSADQEPREITEIEEQILEGVVQILCRELATAWQSLGLQFVSEQRLQPAQIQRLMPPNGEGPVAQFRNQDAGIARNVERDLSRRSFQRPAAQALARCCLPEAARLGGHWQSGCARASASVRSRSSWMRLRFRFPYRRC